MQSDLEILGALKFVRVEFTPSYIRSYQPSMQHISTSSLLVVVVGGLA